MAERQARPPRNPSRGQHFLKSRRLTAEIVQAAEVSRDDLVIEVGAGRGKITAELAARASQVVAVERDPALASHLIERFTGNSRVLVVVGDALDVPWPAQPFRVFANPPFGITTALMRKLLDDPSSHLVRVDLVVQAGLAIKRTRRLPSHLLDLSWGPWWKFEVTKQIPRRAFEPMPSVDAAMLSIRRRRPALMSEEERVPFLELLEKSFTAPSPTSKPNAIDLQGWIEIYRAARSKQPRRQAGHKRG